MTTVQNPIISVVIPAYNDSLLLEKCLQQLRSQRFSFPFEIIVVNGPSKDNTKQVAERYANVVVDQDGIGIGHARYVGCNHAKASIIAITDADVIVPIDWLDRIYQVFSNNKYFIAITGPYVFINSEKLNSWAKITRPLAHHFHRIVYDAQLLSGTNMAVRKDAYQAVGGFDPEISGLEDVELGMRLCKIGKVSYRSDLVVSTTDRRFKHPIKHIFTTLIPAYIKRSVLKKKDKYVIWKPLN